MAEASVAEVVGVEVEVDMDAMRASVARQGAKVRQMKKDGAAAADVKAEVTILKALKAELAEAEAAEAAKHPPFPKEQMEDTLLRRMFYVPAFEIYQGVGGLYDWGPPGCALKSNFISMWRRHFVLEESMLEIECTTLTPDAVLETSGHKDKFSDLMVKDVETGECFRADKLLEDHIENLMKSAASEEERNTLRQVAAKADAYEPEELDAVLAEYGVVSPSSGGKLTPCFPFNLMFTTSIGPEGTQPAFLRPETAQGIFVNFRRLLDYNAGAMPFAAAQVGLAFRNEISPRGGLLRVREFQMAEIEHFVSPTDKSHPKFARVADKLLPLFPRDRQLGDGKLVTMTAAAAVEEGVVDNETLAYFMARTYSFLVSIGINADRLRFRQHLATEMAHYAADCWDVELQVSSGWVECVGIADRSCFDLSAHGKATKVDMVASERLAEARDIEIARPKFNKGVMGRAFKKANKAVLAYLTKLAEEDVAAALTIEAQLADAGSATIGPLDDGNTYELTRDMVTFTAATKRVHEIKYTPSVIEPSFGIGRILYALLEHTFDTRVEDDRRSFFRFPPRMAPVKVSLLPLSNTDVFRPKVDQLHRSLLDAGISTKVDFSGAAIGRRYARTDELGIPFALTVDFQTVEDDTVTLRERDTCEQVRLPAEEAVDLLMRLVVERTTWDRVVAEHSVVAAPGAEPSGGGAASGGSSA